MSLMLSSPCVAAAHARKNIRGQRGSSMTHAEIRAYLLAREAIRKLRATAAPAPSSIEGDDDLGPDGPPDAG